MKNGNKIWSWGGGMRDVNDGYGFKAEGVGQIVQIGQKDERDRCVAGKAPKRP